LPPELVEQIRQSDSTLVWLMVAITVLMAAAFALFGVLVTHRVAGPVYVMSHYIGVVAKGRYPIMRPLRKHDELKVFFERFQSAVESLRGREVEEADELKHALGTLSGIASGEEAKKVLEGLKAMHDRKRDATDRVQIAKA
jgi:hypothetical protein